jgi:hypothetical protein
MSRYPGLELLEIAKVIFYGDRISTLRALLVILKVFDAFSASQPLKFRTGISDDVASLLAGCSFDLINGGLASNLIATALVINISLTISTFIQKLTAEEKELLSKSSVADVLSRDNERQLLTQCLFWVYYQTTPTKPKEEVEKLLNLLTESWSIVKFQRKAAERATAVRDKTPVQQFPQQQVPIQVCLDFKFRTNFS